MGKTQLTNENLDDHLEQPGHNFEVPDGPFVLVALNDYGEPTYLGSKDVQVVVVQADVIDPWWATTPEDVDLMEKEAKFIVQVHELADDESYLGLDVVAEINGALSNGSFEEVRAEIRAEIAIDEQYGQREESSTYAS